MHVARRDVVAFAIANIGSALVVALILVSAYSAPIPRNMALLQLFVPPLVAGLAVGIVRPRSSAASAALGGFIVGCLIGMVLFAIHCGPAPQAAGEDGWGWGRPAALWFLLADALLAPAGLMVARSLRSIRKTPQ
jgi:hypothetical protein